MPAIAPSRLSRFEKMPRMMITSCARAATEPTANFHWKRNIT